MVAISGLGPKSINIAGSGQSWEWAWRSLDPFELVEVVIEASVKKGGFSYPKPCNKDSITTRIGS